jgi:CheY-like chemotaxis protein
LTLPDVLWASTKIALLFSIPQLSPRKPDQQDGSGFLLLPNKASHPNVDRPRPCFLVIDREYPGTISTRKLVIETAKFNVLTAYDAEEGIRTLERFPDVDGVVVDANRDDMPCSELIDRLRVVRSHVTIVVASPNAEQSCGDGVFYVESFDPKNLLALLQRLYEEATQQVKKRDDGILDQR